MILKDFQCTECEEYFEAMVDREAETTECKLCSSEAKKVYRRFNFKLPGTDPGYPGAYDKFARDHEKAAKRSNPS